MRLEIITAERKVYDDDVELVVVPGSDGELGILSKHAPLMSTLPVSYTHLRAHET